MLEKDLKNYRGVGLGRYAFFLPLYRHPGHRGKEMPNESSDRFMILVRCDSERYATVCKLGEEFRNAGVGHSEVCEMPGVEVHEGGAHLCDGGVVAMFFRESAFDQPGDAITHEHRVDFARMSGETIVAEGMVCSVGKIGYGIEKSAVEVKYNESFHIRGLNDYTGSITNNQNG